MKAAEMREKSADDLQKELVRLREAQCGLRMKAGSGQDVKPHEIRILRKDIARVKTFLTKIKQQGNS